MKRASTQERHEGLNLEVKDDVVTFWLRVKPRASAERFEVDSAGALTLAVRAAPSEGQANDAVVEYLARRLRLPRTSVSIQAGLKSRRKLIRIKGAAAETTAMLRTLGGERPKDSV
jgi:uncharacterized protein YggU (UPF0235/DUF167 family)